MKKRISYTWVEEAIKSPDHIERETQIKYRARKKVNGISIEVVYIREKHIKVVTVYWIRI
ncbi:hypothetical protein HZB00_03300 [Candidatus Woesearchaeota archaeon]|nr:hypothetical protein [Candidatus Woesearchaeota archaeon]